ncbi:sorting assembly machinery 35 kDa subunit [[Candida] anglica]|uniref:Sorting assembly machinery 35 kDa subunit n=1 Tax=[Candida] anglica TaxID=148631 RepID=A0ABP0EEB1_9ASCO
MRVPESIKTVFDTFPLKTFPAVPVGSPDQTQAVEDQKFYFRGEPSKDGNSFILGVHSILPIEVDGITKYIPSDPISLAKCLSTCHKNNLKLPISGDEKSGESSNCMMAFAHQASPDQELPLLIHDSNGRDRTFITSRSMSSISIKKVTSVTAQVVLEMIETKLYDLWISCLLVEADETSLNKIFRLNSQSSWTSQLYTVALFQEIPSWRNFNIRHSNLFTTSRVKKLAQGSSMASTFGSTLSALRTNVSLDHFYKDQLIEFEAILQSLTDFIENNEDEDPVVEIEVAAFLISVDQTLKDTKLGKLIQTSLLDRCYLLLSKY